MQPRSRDASFKPVDGFKRPEDRPQQDRPSLADSAQGGRITPRTEGSGGGRVTPSNRLTPSEFSEASNSVSSLAQQLRHTQEILQQRENDLLFAAEIGETLLKKNEELRRKNDDLLTELHSERRDSQQTKSLSVASSPRSSSVQVSQRVEVLEQENSALQTQLNECRGQLSSMSSQISALLPFESANKYLTEEISFLRENLQEMQRSKAVLEAQLVDATAEIEVTSSTQEQWDQQKQLLQKTVKDTMSEAQRLQGDLTKSDARAQKLQSDLSTVKGELSRAVAELLEVREKHEEDMKKANHTNSQISKEVKQHEAKIQILESDQSDLLKDLTDASAERDRLQSERDSLLSQVEELNAIDNSTQPSASIQEELLASISVLKEELKKVKSDCEAKVAMMDRQAQALRSSAFNLTQELSQATNASSQMKAQLQTLASEKDSAVAVALALEREMQEFKDENEMLKKEVQQETNSNLLASQNELRDAREQHALLLSDFEQMRGKCLELEKVSEDNKKQITALQVNIKEFQRTNVSKDHRIHELETESEKSRAAASVAINSSEELKQIKQKLDAAESEVLQLAKKNAALESSVQLSTRHLLEGTQREERQVAALRSQVQQTDQQLKRAITERDETLATNEDLKSAISAHEKTIASIRHENALLQISVEELEESTVEQEKKLAEQEETIEDSRRELREAGNRADFMAQEQQLQASSVTKIQEELRRSITSSQQLRDQHEQIKSDYEGVIEKLQQELRESGLKIAKLESESRSLGIQLSEATRREERQVASLSSELEQLRQSVSHLEAERDTLSSSLKDATAQANLAQNVNSDLKRELVSLRVQVEDKDRAIVTTLADTQQRADDVAARSRQTEADLHEATSSLECLRTTSSEKDTAFKTLQEDYRRSSAALQSLRDATSQAKAETDVLIDGLHRELNELGEKCSKLESQARAATLQLSEVTRREERQVASLRAELEHAHQVLSSAESERDTHYASVESGKATIVFLEQQISELKQQVVHTQRLEGDIQEVSAEIGSARQRAKDESLRCFKLEAELKQVQSNFEAANLDHSSIVASLQEEIRCSAQSLQHSRDQSSKLKADFDSIVNSLQLELSESGSKIAKLESEARVSSVQLLEAARREERQSAAALSEIDQLKMSVSQLGEDRNALADSVERGKTQISSLERIIADLQNEISTLKEIDREQVRESSAALSVALQRADNEAAQCRRLEGELERTETELQATIQEHARLVASIHEDSRRSAQTAKQQRDEQMVKMKMEYDAVIQDLQKDLSDLAIKDVKMESEFRASTLQLQEQVRREERQAVNFRGEIEILKRTIELLEQERNDLILSSDAARTQIAALEQSSNDLHRELSALRLQVGEQDSQSKAQLATARQRVDDEISRGRKLEVEANNLASQLEVMTQQYASELAAVQDEARRSLTKQLRDLSAKLKAEHDEAVSALQTDMQAVSIKNVELESQVRSSSLQVQELTRRLERDSAAFRRKDEETLKQVEIIESQRSDAVTRVAALERIVADLTQELNSLKQLNGEKYEEASSALVKVSSSLFAARQRADEEASQCRRLETELRLAKSQIEAAMQQAEESNQKNASELAAVQDEARRSLTKQLRDLSAKLKAEHDEAVSALQTDMQAVSIKNVELESQVRSSSLQVQELTRRLERDSAAFRRKDEELSAEVNVLKSAVLHVEDERDALISQLESSKIHNMDLQKTVTRLEHDFSVHQGQESSIHIALASARQRAEEEASQCRRLEVELELLRASSQEYESIAQQHAGAFSAAKEEASQIFNKKLRDLSCRLKTEHEEVVSLLQADLQAVSIKNAELESQVRSFSLQATVKSETASQNHAREIETLQEHARRSDLSAKQVRDQMTKMKMEYDIVINGLQAELREETLKNADFGSETNNLTLQLQEQVRRKERQAVNFRGEIEILKRTIELLEQERNDLILSSDAARTQIAALEQSSNDLHRELSALRLQVGEQDSQSKAQLATARQRVDDEISRGRKLEVEANNLASQLEVMTQQYASELAAVQDEARRSSVVQMSSLSEQLNAIQSQRDMTEMSLHDTLNLVRQENAQLRQKLADESQRLESEVVSLRQEQSRFLKENASLQEAQVSKSSHPQMTLYSENPEVLYNLKQALSEAASTKLAQQHLHAQNLALSREVRRLSDELDSYKDILDRSDREADLQKLQSLRWKCLDASTAKIADKQLISTLEATVSKLESQLANLHQSNLELTERSRVLASSIDLINQKSDKCDSSLKIILSLCERLSNPNDDHSSSFLSEIQKSTTAFGDSPYFSQIVSALRAISSAVHSKTDSGAPIRAALSPETVSSDAETKVLRFQLSSLASQLKRAETVILDLNARNDAQEPNAILSRKVSELETALRSMTSDRDDAMKRYLSIVTSLQSVQEQLHVVALDFVTLRRNEAQLCLELRSQNTDSSSQSFAAAVAGIRQRLARQRDTESDDMQREVEELLREWGQGSSDGVLTRLDLEAVRSAKKRSLLKEQNEMISQLQTELQQLRQAYQVAITGASSNDPLSVNHEAPSPTAPSEVFDMKELQRRIEFCETERRSSAVLVDSLSQRLAEEESASQELKATLAVVQVDCSIAQDALFRNQSLNARRKTAAVSLCASLIEARRRLVLSQSMHSWTLLVTAGQFRDIQQRMSAMALQVNPAFAPELLNGAQHWASSRDISVNK